ncbi:hypothetical protein [Caulobacter sp. DWR1-3-2b1]|uniref:hypothetical protein n=1 Tax=Caulobacter sp. DWR1-3-2b1 TaxID=2804670 RepID=UPI003CEE168B
MPRPVRFTMVVDRRKDAVGVITPPSYRLYLPRPMMIGATLLFWAAVVVGLKLLVS